MDIRPKIIGSCRAIDSQRALSSGWQRLLAFGNNSCILIIDPNTGNLFQSLNLHLAPVIQITWAPENYYHDAKNPYCHRLASADTSGRIIIWNVVSGTALAEATEPNSEVYGMHWISDQDISRDLLVVLHSDNRLVLWNAQTCTMLWRKTFAASVTTALTSFSFDPFTSQSLMLHGTNSFILVNDFSWNSPPPSDGKQILFSDAGELNGSMGGPGDHRGRFSKVIKATAKAVIGDRLFRNSKNIKDVAHSNSEEVRAETPIQLLFHGYRKQHAVFVYSREIIIFDLVLCQPVGTISLEPTAASFMQVYSCHLADVLICLHVTGSISVQCYLPIIPNQPPIIENNHQNHPLTQCNDLNYVHLCESKSLRRGRNFRVIAMTVDPSKELAVTVATSDGRLQFLTIEGKETTKCNSKEKVKKEEEEKEEEEENDVWPMWTLIDLITSIDPAKMDKSLRLRFTGFYCGASPAPTVCSVCPAHFLLPIAASLQHSSLIALGTMRGNVQIWDIHSTHMWREYQLLSVPIRGIAWGTVPNATAATQESQPPHGLCLFAYGWQSSENGLQDVLTATSGVKNFVVALDLTTGHQQQICTNRSDDHELRLLKLAMQKGHNSGIKAGSWWNVASELTEHAMSSITPIRLMSVSNSGQYLSILFENWPLEIWDARKLILLKSFPHENSHPVALTWSTVNPQRSISMSLEANSQPISNQRQDDDQQDTSAISPLLTEDIDKDGYIRETFILCTSPVSLRLFTMEGAEMDSMPISNTIVQSLPASSRNSITCATWRSPMIAFGMSDGCIAVRNLQTKETLVRHMSVLVQEMSAPFAGSNQNAVSNGQISGGTDHAVTQSSSGGLIVTSNGTDASAHQAFGLTKVEFLKTSGPSCRLLTLCAGAVAVWEPRKMVLVCVARFGNSPQKTLIDAAWSSVIPVGSSIAAPTCALLALDGSLRLAKAGSLAANKELLDNQESPFMIFSEYNPSSNFEFSSPISFAESKPKDLPLVPSILPLKVTLNLRHLLQHQPWRRMISHSSEDSILSTPVAASKEEVITEPSTSLYSLSCPQLNTGFNDVFYSVDGFMAKLKEQKELCKAFESPTLGIAERCLLTALVFGDTYETSFWRLANYRLFSCEEEDGKSSLSSSSSGRRKKRRFRLDIVWDAMAEKDIYRSTVVERVNRLTKEPSTVEQSKLCSQYLLMLGFQQPAIAHLAETRPESPNFSLSIHRACLLAANVYIQTLEGKESSADSPARIAYTSSVKLLAANLISNNHLHEGVELLCILGMHKDACRYLETYNEWGTAVWLAKCTLNKEESNEVMRRWAVYLASHANRKTLAILVLVYLGQHDVVLNLLHSLRQHQLATRYLEACLECKVITQNSKSKKLHSQIFLEFARLLMSLGHKDSTIYYADLAGELGEGLREEVDFLLN